jgi:hypothetical protein
MEQRSSGDTVLLLSTLREREQILDAISRSSNRIALIAIVAERGT